MVTLRGTLHGLAGGFVVTAAIALLARAHAQGAPPLVLGPKDYVATVGRVVDGDTVDLRVRAWPNTIIEDRFRLFGIDAPEVRGAEREEGRKSTEWLVQHLAPHAEIIVRVQDKRGKYGRWIAVLLVPGEDGQLIDLNTLMVKEGFAEVANY